MTGQEAEGDSGRTLKGRLFPGRVSAPPCQCPEDVEGFKPNASELQKGRWCFRVGDWTEERGQRHRGPACPWLGDRLKFADRWQREMAQLGDVKGCSRDNLRRSMSEHF